MAGLEQSLKHDLLRVGFITTYVYVSVVRQSSESLVQRLVHFLGVAFEEAATACRKLVLRSVAMLKLSLTANEKRVASEHSTVISIFEEEANTVLCVARSVQSFDLDVLTDSESFAVGRGGGDFFAVFAADDGERVAFEDFGVAAGVVMVAG